MLPVLWLCGAPGAGKSTVAWELVGRLGSEGITVGYVDIDQLGMLYPADDNDPERYSLKAAALAAVLPHHVAAGAHAVVVSGVVDPYAGPTPADLLPGARVVWCLLTADGRSLRQRIEARGWDDDKADEAVALQAALERTSYVRRTVDTTGRSVADVTERVYRHVPPVPGGLAFPPVPTVPEPTCGVTLVSGPRAVGKSTVSYLVAQDRWRRGVCTGFVDLEQLSFRTLPARGGRVDRALGIGALGAVHRLFASHGATHLIASGAVVSPDEDAMLRKSVAPARVRVVRLSTDAGNLRDRIGQRYRPGPARLIGDDLLGADREAQAAALAGALAEQRAMTTAGLGDLVLDTCSRTPDELAHAIEIAIGQPEDSA